MLLPMRFGSQKIYLALVYRYSFCLATKLLRFASVKTTPELNNAIDGRLKVLRITRIV